MSNSRIEIRGVEISEPGDEVEAAEMTSCDHVVEAFTSYAPRPKGQEFFAFILGAMPVVVAEPRE